MSNAQSIYYILLAVWRFVIEYSEVIMGVLSRYMYGSRSAKAYIVAVSETERCALDMCTKYVVWRRSKCRKGS